MPEIRSCRISGKTFEISDEDIAFYKKIGVPLPTLCPEERQRRRLQWRNERHLYHRECGFCKKPILSIYSRECRFSVYCETCFWGDKWDFRNYGKDFDFGKPFFEQIAELQNEVPRLAITHTQSVNSDYTLNSIQNKNCYMTSGADFNEDCLYGINTQRSKDCVDHYLIYDSQICYGCLDSSRLYNCIGCQESEQCRDSWFLYDCKGCENCAFSSNLRNKKYVLRNRQLAKETYEKELAEILKTLFHDPDWMDKNRRETREKAIHRSNLIIGSENVSGNNIRYCKNTHDAFDAENLEDCKYLVYALDVKDSYDFNCVGFKCVRIYEVISAAFIYNVYFSNAVFPGHDMQYCIGSWNCSDLFGCISTHNHKQYCILNKQYSRGEYQKLIPKIIEYMKETGEYGEFFPAAISPFEYNRSSAVDYMPIGKDEALKMEFRWFEGQEEIGKRGFEETPECVFCGKKYLLVKQELDFYKKLDVSAPQLCWQCRLQRLIGSRKPRKLFENTCKKCGVGIQTPVAPNRPEKVYCEKCYLAEVY